MIEVIPIKALILAAGYATRLYPLTRNTPKALLPIGGKPMLDYLVREIATLPDLREVHIVSNHKFFAHFRAWADEARAQGRYPGLSFTVWDDGTTSAADRLGAVGDIGFVIERAALDDDLLVAASDNFFTFPLRPFAEAFALHGKDTLLVSRIEDPETIKRFAVVQVDEEGRVLHLEEKPAQPRSDLGVYALYLYRRDTLPLFAQYLAQGHSPDAPGHFPEWLYKQREVRIYRFEGECVDIGTPEAYAEICRRYAPPADAQAERAWTQEHKYLLLPVRHDAPQRQLRLWAADAPICDLKLRLDADAPDEWYPLDLTRFLGQRLRARCEPACALPVRTAQTPPAQDLLREPARPRAHFTAAYGWINDPNGLVWLDGLYHLFFQWNPVGSEWGNMHWGHATSPDLLTWTQAGPALHPDALGDMFSGGATLDPRNRSGLAMDGRSALLYYTAAGGCSALSAYAPFTQCVARLSADGTVEKYEDNPILGPIEGQNRDPRVVYVPEEEAHYMALYLADDRYALLRSQNLLDFDFVQTLSLPGDAECPDLYPLTLEGKVYWVFCGASDRYLIGRFEDGFFRPLQSVRALQHGPGMSYAAQTFAGTPQGRTVRMAWCRARLPGQRFQCSLCTPTEMRLLARNGQILLAALPIAEFSLPEEAPRFDRPLDAGQVASTQLADAAFDLVLTARGAAALTVSLPGLSFAIDLAKERLLLAGQEMPLFARDGEIRLRMVGDTNAVEIYAGEGEAFLCAQRAPTFAGGACDIACQTGRAQVALTARRLAALS